jgi:hypothetical protein
MAGAGQAEIFYQDTFDNDTLAVNTNGIGGGAVNRTIEGHAWDDDGSATLVTSGTTFTRRALFYSENTFQSNEGFKLTVYYTTGSIGDVAAHNFSFGLISSDTDLSAYADYNPFKDSTTNIYSLGLNLTADIDTTAQGLNFTDGSICTTLDQAGDNVQFVAGSSSWVVLDIGPDGAWQYSVNGVTEASGVIAGGFDLSKSYRVAVYGQDDTSKSIQSLKLEAYNPLPGQGERADWMRGAWGALWLPEKTYNGNIEGVTIDEFVTQIEGLKTIDYVQLGLTSPSIYSPVHMAPHDLIESLWQGDTDDNGDPINLCCPRSSVDDPFLSWLEALNAAGLKVEVYVNSYNLLARNPDSIPDDYPDFSARWMAWCDTNETAQAFINSQSYHSNGSTNRPYMFCYAEFVLKEYAVRYGDLIDAWCFDSADNIMEDCGDDADSGILDDQRIYEAFANAVHAGNPNAAVAFNNSVGTAAAPFATPTLFDDYTFGHPFGGAGDMVETESLYNRNYGICEYMSTNNGLPFATTDSRSWNDKVVGHFFPKQSTTSWNAGANPCLSNDQFVAWTDTGIVNGGAITWGTALWYVNLENPGYNLTLRDYALEQLELTDAHLSTNQFPGVPNWRRSDTPLPEAISGQPFSHTLIDGVDFWDPSAGSITDLLLIDAPDWLTVTNSGSGVWTLGGLPTESETTDYSFELCAMTGTTGTSRTVELTVWEPEPVLTNIMIQAVANTNYGTDAVATLFSAVQTNGAATFQIAIDVIPMDGTSITSAGGLWGINAEEGAGGWWNTFDGSLTQSVDSVANIRVVSFNANGGGLTLDDFSDFSFKSVSVYNANNSADRVAVVAGDVANAVGGLKMDYSPATIDLQTLAGSACVSSFTLANGNLGNAKDRWNIGGIQVEYSIRTSSGESYTAWVSGYGLMDDDALVDADVENGGIGDGYDNLAEFALGMNPTNSDAGSRDWITVASEDGTNWVEYIHHRRSDYVADGLSYLLIDSTNLVSSGLGTNTQDQILVGPSVDGYEPVTNRYMMDSSVKFIELKIKTGE